MVETTNGRRRNRAVKKTITAHRISYYAKVCASHTRLEKLRYKIRDEILEQLSAGAIPAVTGPFILDKSAQHRVDPEKWSWKMFSTELAMRLGKALGYSETDTVRFAMGEVLTAELTAPRKEVTVLQAKPNPAYLGELRLNTVR